MRTNSEEWELRKRKSLYNRRKWQYYDEEGQGPIRRFLRTDNPENVYPNQRIILFFIFGFALSIVGMQLSADEYYVGPIQPIAAPLVSNHDFPVHIAFKDLGCVIGDDHRHVLHRVTGEILPGRLTGVMGQSGSGKTTFAYALLGRGQRYCNPLVGNVYLNGRPRNLEAFLDRVGYVPQDDVLYPELTVEESLRFSANWRIPRSITRKQKDELVEETLKVLDLLHIRDQRIGDVQNRGISGGEKKRVSIGMELIAQPSVLVMDEPTSGLDSAAAFRLVQTLRSIAETGVSVVAVIHQPSVRVFELLHDVIFMQKGQLVYGGDREAAASYFASLGFQVPSTHSEQCTFPLAEFLLDALAGLEVPEGQCAPDQGSCEASDGANLAHSFRAHQSRSAEWDRIEKNMERYKTREDEIMHFYMTGNTTEHGGAEAEKKLSKLVDFDGMVRSVMRFLHSSFCPKELSNTMTELLCPVLDGWADENILHPYVQLPKPGLKRQLNLWFWQMSTLMFRKGVLIEGGVISVLASVVALVRSYNVPWNRRALANFLLSVAIGLLGMVGAVFHDNIGPVQRASASGMLLGAHEFALLAHVIIKGWLSCHFFSLVYFSVMWTRTNTWCCVSQKNIDYARFHTYYEFCHMIHLNYMASSGLGSVICVVCNHHLSTSYIVAVATLMAAHVFAFFTPNKNQVARDSLVLEGAFGDFKGFDIAPLVEGLCRVSYVRYFMEAIMLWEPDKFYDKNGRKYTLRYFGYEESNKTWCCTMLFFLWTCAQAFRFIIFAFLNSNDFHSLYDTPMLLAFILKVMVCHFLALVIMTFIQEWYFPWNASIQRQWGWKQPSESPRSGGPDTGSSENPVDVLG